MSLGHILHGITQDVFAKHLQAVERVLNTDVLTIISPIMMGLENFVRNAIESTEDKKDTLAVILDTGGGVVEVVERMVDTIRHHYTKVIFIVPDRAMSAGTVFVMSGDQIYMSYFSVLGPIDPQLEKDGKMIPVLSYLDQYERLKEEALSGQLTTVDYALIEKLDLAELQWFEQAKELSVDLLKNWLSQYKFKDWKTHSSNGNSVTTGKKEERAEDIARILSDNKKWHSHSRGLSKKVLESDLNLKIEDIDSISGLTDTLDTYLTIVKDYMFRENRSLFIQTRGLLL